MTTAIFHRCDVCQAVYPSETTCSGGPGDGHDRIWARPVVAHGALRRIQMLAECAATEMGQLWGAVKEGWRV